MGALGLHPREQNCVKKLLIKKIGRWRGTPTSSSQNFRKSSNKKRYKQKLGGGTTAPKTSPLVDGISVNK